MYDDSGPDYGTVGKCLGPTKDGCKIPINH